jgi:hypothetical protein
VANSHLFLSFFQVMLDSWDIQAEVSATTHAAAHRYSASAKDSFTIIVSARFERELRECC